MVNPQADIYSSGLTGTLYAGRAAPSGAPAPPPPPPPPPTLVLSGPASVTVGVAAQYQVTAANLTTVLPSAPQVTPSGTLNPTTVNPAPGELTKLFQLTAIAAGVHQLSVASISGGIVSNTLTVTAAPAPAPTPPPPPPPPPPVGSTVANIVVGPEGGETLAAGTYSWAVAVFPLRGQVPAGSVLRSTGLASLRSTVTSTWDDGSAAIIVGHGTTTHTLNEVKSLSLQTSAESVGRGWNLGFDTRVEADYDAILSHGAKVARCGITLTPSGSSFTINSSHLTNALEQAAWAERRGLQLFVTVYAGENEYLGPLWAGANAAGLQASLLSIWTAFASTFSRFRNVVFQPLNEPQDFGSALPWTTLLSSIIEAVRAIDPGRKIAAGASPHNTPAGFVGRTPLPYPNIVYPVHVYDPYAYTHQGVGGEPSPVAFTAGQAVTQLAAVRAFQQTYGAEVVVTEFSTARDAPNRIDWINERIALFATYGWGWMYHTYRGFERWDPEMSSDLGDFTRRPTEPTFVALLGAMAGQERNLGVSAIAAQVTSVSVAFDGGYGTAVIIDFGAPERIWWANPHSISARYRVAAPTPGSTQLEAVIDIEACQYGADVEGVIENCKMNTATPVAPVAASYAAAVVSVNGVTVQTVNGNGAPEGAHSRFRSTYFRHTIGYVTKTLRARQSHTQLQQHPLLFKADRPMTADITSYATDNYTPWSTGRQRATGMGAGGDHASIGPLSTWEARFLQSGDARAARATEVSALACLGYNINYRDTATGLVPTFAQLVGKSQNGYSTGNANNWPDLNTDPMGWEVAHHPAAGLMAFAARPSPVFIELAQKVAVWNGTWSVVTGGTPTPTGVFGPPYQRRGRAWCMRSLAHATFLTPDGMPWKPAAKASIAQNVTFLDEWRTDSKALLGVMWDNRAGNDLFDESTTAGFQTSLWQNWWIVAEVHKIASARLLTGAQQTAINTLADWLATGAVRWITEQSNGGWRFIPYKETIGDSPTTINSLSTWALERNRAGNQGTTPPAAVAGTWMTGDVPTAWTQYTAHNVASAGTGYPTYFWPALMAAYERAVTNASTALQTVLDNVTNLTTWRDGFGGEARYAAWPRNYTPSGFASDGATGSYNTTTSTWTPGRNGEGVVSAASWALVPSGRWTIVDGTRIDALDSVVKAAIPSWTDPGNGKWTGVLDNWNGFAVDYTLNELLTAAAGGHGDTSNNGVYKFQVLKMAWAIDRLPSDSSVWSSAYRGSNGTGSYTFCSESNAESSARITAGTLAASGGLNDANNWLYDELFWDRRPTSRHIYEGLVPITTTNELILLCRRLWRYDRTTKDWTHKRLFNDSISHFQFGENVLAVFDEVTSEVLVSSRSSGGAGSLIFNTVTQAWSFWSVPWNIWGGNCGMTRRGREMIVFSNPDPGRPDYEYPGKYWVYNLDTRTATTSGDIQYEAGLVKTDLGANRYDNAIEWIPGLNEFWVWLTYNDGVPRTFALDPTTTPWTLKRRPLTGAVPTPHPNLRRKTIYMPSINAIVMGDAGNKNMHVYKF